MFQLETSRISSFPPKGVKVRWLSKVLFWKGEPLSMYMVAKLSYLPSVLFNLLVVIGTLLVRWD